MMNVVVRLFVFAAMFMASACVSILPEAGPPKARYHMTPVEGAVGGAKVNWSLVVDDPRATRVYDSVRIAVSTAPGKVEYYGGGEWADRAPRLFLTALVQSFENSGRIIAVGDRSALPIADIALQTDIRRLEFVVQRGERAALVSIYARLSDGKGGIYAARPISSSVETRSDRASDVIAAFDVALNNVQQELVSWALEEGAKANAN